MGSFNDCLEPVENKEYIILERRVSSRSSFSLSSFKNKIPSEPYQSYTKQEKGITNSNRRKNIDILSSTELCDIVSIILRVRVPFSNNRPLQSLFSLSLLTGNGPYHEGLIILTQRRNIYVTQIYPITFIKVMNINEAIYQIMSYNAFNLNKKKYYISDIYTPHQPIIVMDIYYTVRRYPNKYNMFTDNCQRFCSDIIIKLAKKYKIKRDNKPESTKIKYEKIKMLYR